ncbi:hypothetical protein [Aestuariivirga sp.]|uniref:hypothetical protein n=1 Tax=Aestuariivirga sp. TaxID=2650926 RepID=UPI003593B602
MTDKVKVPFPIAQTAALRARVRELRREAARKLCPNPLQVVRVAELLAEIADAIEEIVMTRNPRVAAAN